MNTKTIYILFGIALLFFLVLIFNLFFMDSKTEYKRTIKATVVEVYNVRGRPLQLTATLSDGSSIDVPVAFIPKIQVDDSIIKKANTTIYYLKSKKYSTTFTYKK